MTWKQKSGRLQPYPQAGLEMQVKRLGEASIAKDDNADHRVIAERMLGPCETPA